MSILREIGMKIEYITSKTANGEKGIKKSGSCFSLDQGESESESRSVTSHSATTWRSPWNSPGQNTGVGSLSFLQGIFPIQVSHVAGRFFTS